MSKLRRWRSRRSRATQFLAAGAHRRKTPRVAYGGYAERLCDGRERGQDDVIGERADGGQRGEQTGERARWAAGATAVLARAEC